MMEDFYENDNVETIAIIGMAGRFPGARNTDEFWHNLREGVESISFFSDDELKYSGIDPTILSHPRYVKAKGVLQHAEKFDASFFGYSPAEAQSIDPQHRVFLECGWEALENAGYDTEAYGGSIGVYAGATLSSFVRNVFRHGPNYESPLKSNPELGTLIGVDKDHLTTRLSYKLNLKGPSIGVQTACSTSLVAICLACQGLLTYQCDIALAGGVSIRIPAKCGYQYQEEGILSPDGHCRSFDAEARGTVGGDGVGIVVLKRLREALEEGDNIHAVIKGFAINNDGSSKIGYTAPSMEGQSEVVAMAQSMAGIDADSITYVEAHGTGTILGDPIEVSALTRAFRTSTNKNGYCALGSLKTNIGHLDAAAGVAGLIKIVLALKNKLLPPSLHFKETNPKIVFENSPFYVNTRLAEWTPECGVRRAGLSSFGIGGTNAHVIVEEAPESVVPYQTESSELIVLSAKTETALASASRRLVAHLKHHPELCFADVAFTLQVGRRMLNHRLMLLGRDTEDTVAALESKDPRRVLIASGEHREQNCVFMFSGQGAQYPNMALGLYQKYEIFRNEVNRCCEVLRSTEGIDLHSVMYPGRKNLKVALEQLKQTEMAQLALFVIEYSLSRLLMNWGIMPCAMIGHSVGEYVAACLAGVFTLEDGLEMVCTRGHLMGAQPAGAMVSVRLPADEVAPLLNEELSLASINAPSVCVVSGPTNAVEKLEYRLSQLGVVFHRLHTSHAFHSKMMEPVTAPFAETASRLELAPPRIPYISNVTGTWVRPQEALDPLYWVNHLRQTALLSKGLKELLKEPGWLYLEVGPGNTMVNLVREHSSTQAVYSTLRHPKDSRPDIDFLLNSLGRLWLAGMRVEWARLYADQPPRRRIPLPTYPFERQLFQVGRQVSDDSGLRSLGGPVKNSDIRKWFYVPAWKSSVFAANAEGLPSKILGKRWMVFLNSCSISSQIADGLVRAGCEVIRVTAAKCFASTGPHDYSLNPESSSDYDALFSELQRLNKLPERIIHCWGLTQNGTVSIEKALNLGFYSLLFLAQALIGRMASSQTRIFVITNQVQGVTGEETLCPEKAMVLGPCKVIPQERYTISCTSIDIELPKSGTQNERWLLESLLAELAADSEVPVLAYRGRQRWVQTFEEMPLVMNSPSRIPLREGGVYLVTGGLGDVGLAMAAYLARTVQAKLILTARSLLPRKNQWKTWLETHDEQDKIHRRIREVMAIERLGSEVIIRNADVADLQEMKSLVEEGEDRFGKINGVIHAAGIVKGPSIAEVEKLRQKDCEEQFRPKVNGVLVIKELFSGRSLDFCMLTSSLATVLGGLGFSAYAAANQFMDTLSLQQHHFGIRDWISVNWDGWLVREKRETSTVPAVAEYSMTPEEGVRALEQTLRLGSVSQVIVSTGDLQTRLRQWIKLESPDADGEEVVDIAQYSRPQLTNPYIAPQTETQRSIAALWQVLLAIDKIGIRDNFFELGGNSLMAIQLLSRLHGTFYIDLSLAKLLELDTVDKLATHIDAIQWVAKDRVESPEGSGDEREVIEL
jgi:acyl transferase domain-containing protein